MMTTPICDFVKKYISDNKVRLHMPGHKGKTYLGIEPFDITEIKGADSLFEADGIIRESEKNAEELFGSGATYYSTEGSSLCIRTMVALSKKYAITEQRSCHIIAARNAHKTFISACALLDIEVSYIPEENVSSYLACDISYGKLEEMLKTEKPVGVYVNSVDYLGNLLDIQKLSAICHRYNTLLIVDNAHGAYLKFIDDGACRHPLSLGADLCCDSAHKTLPVLTGGAYLHISKNAPPFFKNNTKALMSLFASTSPSYLILQSLDMANCILSSDYPKQLSAFVNKMQDMKSKLRFMGLEDISSEVLKITLKTKPYGYTGNEFANELRRRNMECEFSDPDFTVLMFTPDNDDIDMILDKIISIPRKKAIEELPPKYILPRRVMSIRDAVFAPSKTVPVSDAKGKILSSLNVGCPPAVPIVVCGEEITKEAIGLFEYYGIKTCDIVVND